VISYEWRNDWMLLLTRKLLNQWFLVVKLKLSLRKFYGRGHELVNSHKWSLVCFACRKQYPIISSFITYHPFYNRSTYESGII
jgi:hypothetical protein